MQSKAQLLPAVKIILATTVLFGAIITLWLLAISLALHYLDPDEALSPSKQKGSNTLLHKYERENR